MCVFPTADLLRLTLHAILAPNHRMGYESDAPPAPGLLLVHDQGVYLMSNGLPADTAAAETGQHVVYADGCNPNIGSFDEWYDTSRELVGGDDFVEVLPFGDPQEFVTNCTNYHEFCVDLTDNQLEAFFRESKARPSTARRGNGNARRSSPAN